MALIGSTASWGAFGLGLVLLIAILLRRSARYQRRVKREARQPVRRVRPSHDREPLCDAPPDVLRWQVEMHELARDLKGEIDSKMMLLQQLIREAADEADRLEEAIRGVRGYGKPVDEPANTDSAAEYPDATLGTASDPGEQPLSPLGDEVTRQVHQLADSGLSASAIAARLHLPVGDVEWTLSLRG